MGSEKTPFLSAEEWKPQVIVLPIPVPIFVPVPMHLYCQKVPVPFSMPIPVSFPSRVDPPLPLTLINCPSHPLSRFLAFS